MKVGDTNESYVQFIYEVLELFLDTRYYCIGGMPILLIYRPSMIPNPEKVINEWKRIVRDNIHKELYVIAVQEKGDRNNWCECGFNAETEFQPKRVNDIAKDITDDITFINKNFNGTVYDYKDLVNNRKYIIKSNVNKKVYPAVMPMWDNTARRNYSGIIYHGASPRLYGRWLFDAIQLIMKNKKVEQNIVFINAWNEWGEGTYLEPDRTYGYAYLEETYQVLKECDNQLFK